MARAGLLLGRSDDPDVVAELARDALQNAQAAGVHAVVVGEENAHAKGLWGRHPGAATAKEMRHIRNSLAISSQECCQFLLSTAAISIGAVGDGRLHRITPGKVSTICHRVAPVGRPRRGGSLGPKREGLALV